MIDSPFLLSSKYISAHSPLVWQDPHRKNLEIAYLSVAEAMIPFRQDIRNVRYHDTFFTEMIEVMITRTTVI